MVSANLLAMKYLQTALEPVTDADVRALLLDLARQHFDAGTMPTATIDERAPCVLSRDEADKRTRESFSAAVDSMIITPEEMAASARFLTLSNHAPAVGQSDTPTPRAGSIQARIIEIVRRSQPIDAAAIAKELAIKDSNAAAHMTVMTNRGFVVRAGYRANSAGKGIGRLLYTLPDFTQQEAVDRGATFRSAESQDGARREAEGKAQGAGSE